MTRSLTVSCSLLAAAAPFLTGCGGGGSTSTPPPPSFVLSATPANPSVGQGGSATSTIAVMPQNGFSGSVSLSASGLPSGVTVSFNPSSTRSTSVLTLTATGASVTGTSTVTITGTSGSLAPTTPLSITVAAPSVSVALSPSHAAVVTSTQTQTFIANVTGNVNDLSLSWSVDGMAGGNATTGTISPSGVYTPPAAAGTHTVAATSVAVPSSSASASVAVTDLAGVFTYHNDLARDGGNTQEYALSSATVNTTRFGKLFSCAVDGAVYTQPLWVRSLNIAGGTHNVIFVATQHDSVYAFDADATPCVTYWQANLLDTLHGGTTGEVPVVWDDVGYCYGDIYPEVGVTGTPVIDPATNTIYMVAASEIPGAQSGNCALPPGSYYHRLHALDIISGNEKFQAPVTIAAQVIGTGDGSSGGFVNFNSQLENQRAGLALSGDGTVYVAFSAHEDATPYHGWLLGYQASNVQQQVSYFNTTPNGIGGSDGGIWAGGGAPAIDNGNAVYIATGNGVFDEGSGMAMENDYGDSVLRLSPVAGSTANGANLQLAGWFAPWDEQTLENNDTDLGSGGPVLLPDQASSPVHLLVEVGKDGVAYLIDRDNMGQFRPSDNNQIVQNFPATSAFYGTPAFWQNSLYFAGSYAGTTDALKQFSFSPATGLFNTAVSSHSSQNYGFPDVSPSVSSQGSSNGIIWAVDAGLYGYASPNAAGGVNCYQVPVPATCTGPAILHAYDATNLGQEYWNSTQAAANRDRAGNAVKFVPPTVANGKVYVGTRTEIDVYGLLPN